MSTEQRNIILCFDGTSNEVVSTPTNVLRLCQCLVQDEEQLVYYAPGVGTLLDPYAITDFRKYLRKLIDLATGFSLQQSVSAGYEFIAQHYRPGDRLYIFGFSRGAYAARAVAGMLQMFGRLRPANVNLIAYLWQCYRNNIFQPRRARRGSQELFDNARRYRKLFAADEPPQIEFVGVFDTVSSFLSTQWNWPVLLGWAALHLAGIDAVWGVPLWPLLLLAVFAILFRWLPYTWSLPNARHVRHAIALDEYRAFFPCNHIAGLNPEHVEVWFAGVHTDVGGGRPETKSQLSKVALRWMLGEAVARGVRVDPLQVREQLTDRDPLGAAGHSMTWYWLLAGLVPQRRLALRHAPGRVSGQAKAEGGAVAEEQTNHIKWYWPNFWRHRYLRRGDRIHASLQLRRESGLLPHPRLSGTTWDELTVVGDLPLPEADA